VMHTHNWENRGLQFSLGKKVGKTPSHKARCEITAHTRNSSYKGGIGRRMVV
jgi:hypothetical protein